MSFQVINVDEQFSCKTVSSVTSFQAKLRAAADRYASVNPDERPPCSVLPGDMDSGTHILDNGRVSFASKVSKLPGDQYIKNARKRASKVFGSMSEAFAVPAAA